MKKKKYLILGVVTFAIIAFIFIIQGIFPFGNNSIIWSDMHEQITALYYHFYDAVRGNGSLLVDFTSGGAINFLGIIAYYILSPFTLILLLFPRELVENAVSIVVALKILASSFTCLYFISKYFNKLKPSYQIMLSLLYAFSSYTLNLYIITPWMDMVYLLPILLIALKKLLDLEDTKMYIIVLSISLICSFYVSFMTLLFIIFTSLLYLYIYKKENMKKAIFNLGVATVISLLIASFILVPTFLEIAASERVGFDISYILNSKLGPLSDKISFIFASALLIALIMILLLNYKKHKKFSLFIFINLLLLGLPLIIEPINKLWHFGSYVSFPYRYGYLLIFMLVVGASYTLSNVDIKLYLEKFKKIVPYLSVALSFIVMFFVFYKFRGNIQKGIDDLTLTRDKLALIGLFMVFVIYFISSFAIFVTNKKNSKVTMVSLFVLVLSNILFNSYFYLHKYDPKGLLDLQYDQMESMYNSLSSKTGKYYVKLVNRELISNFGMVANVNTFSNYTSLTNHTNYTTMQKLGYDSYWMDTESIGGNLFTDILLAQKYIVTNDKLNDSYYRYIDTKKGLNYYEFIYNMPYGYIIKDNPSLENVSDSFEASNIIYNSITEKEKIFDIYTLYSKEELTKYDKDVTLSQTVKVEGRKRIYLELFAGFDNVEKGYSYDAFNIYVNGELLEGVYPNKNRNGSILLGEYNNEEVKIDIVSAKKTYIRHITLGVLDLDKIDDFVSNYALDKELDASFENGIININVEGEKDDILFIPRTYLDGYDCSTNEIFRVYDNFLGIKLNDGVNNVEISYIPKGLGIGIALSILGVLLFIVWNVFLKNNDFSFLYNITYYAYLVIYALLVLVFYVIGILAFVKSFLF